MKLCKYSLQTFQLRKQKSDYFCHRFIFGSLWKQQALSFNWFYFCKCCLLLLFINFYQISSEVLYLGK